jgi:hypothetical protein
MTLLELRRYAIRNNTRIRFRLDAAGECVVNEHGVLTIPSLRSVPDFNAASLLDSVGRFVLESCEHASKRQELSAEQLRAVLRDAPKAGDAHED